MAALITLAVAKTHLGITVSTSDDDVSLKMLQASDIIISYLKVATSPPMWDITTVPPRVQAAVLLVLAHLFEHRGDDSATVDEALWLAIGRLLVRDRDPALA